MDRRGDFIQVIADETPADIDGIYEKIIIDFQNNRDSITDNFVTALEIAMNRCILLQQKDQKGAVESILISPTYYGMCTGSYELSISVFDEKMYFDRAEAMAFWKADFVYKYVDTHMPVISDLLKKRFLRVMQYEIDEVRQIYACLYHELLIEPLMLLAENIKDSDVFKTVNKQQTVRVLYGYYMEKYKEIGSISSEVAE